ncbi:hypothetical protein A9Q97_06390 [Rhodospirillales bacterium 47_12_T64]|mgnify:CR=1 FL=1|nr:hypothetical protein A9Q97_06390 [Rhodospirillales bacterium 47_12_T64]
MPFMEMVFLDDGRVLRPCGLDDLEAVSELVLTEAERSIRHDFDEDGWADFVEYLSSDHLLKRLVTGSKALVIQDVDDKLSGYIEMVGGQILLLFIAEHAQRLNLASRLLNRIRDTFELKELYVNSSTAGFDFYLDQQFEPVEDWKLMAGVKFRPMKWQENSG